MNLSSMPVMVPTVGRRLWFWPCSTLMDKGFRQLDPKQPCDAGVIYVHPDGTVNVMATDHRGVQVAFHNVPVLPADALRGDDPSAAYAQWMPYQAAQAVKAQ